MKFEYSVSGVAQLRAFVGNSLGRIVCARRLEAKAEAEIFTLEDGSDGRCKHIATAGDYIVKGVNGEFWPVKPDIFEESYEELPV